MRNSRLSFVCIVRRAMAQEAMAKMRAFSEQLAIQEVSHHRANIVRAAQKLNLDPTQKFPTTSMDDARLLRRSLELKLETYAPPVLSQWDDTPLVRIERDLPLVELVEVAPSQSSPSPLPSAVVQAPNSPEEEAEILSCSQELMRQSFDDRLNKLLDRLRCSDNSLGNSDDGTAALSRIKARLFSPADEQPTQVEENTPDNPPLPVEENPPLAESVDSVCSWAVTNSSSDSALVSDIGIQTSFAGHSTGVQCDAVRLTVHGSRHVELLPTHKQSVAVETSPAEPRRIQLTTVTIPTIHTVAEENTLAVAALPRKDPVSLKFPTLPRTQALEPFYLASEMWQSHAKLIYETERRKFENSFRQ